MIIDVEDSVIVTIELSHSDIQALFDGGKLLVRDSVDDISYTVIMYKNNHKDDHE